MTVNSILGFADPFSSILHLLAAVVFCVLGVFHMLLCLEGLKACDIEGSACACRINAFWHCTYIPDSVSA